MAIRQAAKELRSRNRTTLILESACLGFSYFFFSSFTSRFFKDASLHSPSYRLSFSFCVINILRTVRDKRAQTDEREKVRGN